MVDNLDFWPIQKWVCKEPSNDYSCTVCIQFFSSLWIIIFIKWGLKTLSFSGGHQRTLKQTLGKEPSKEHTEPS